MSKIETSRPARIDTALDSPRPSPRKKPGLAHQLLKPLASLRLTVVLFVLSVVLVFFGTLAQMDNGIWTVVGQYFRSLYVWIPYQLAVKFGVVFFGVSPKLEIPGAFPFPGGWLIGSLLLVNLIAAHLVRFRMTWKRSGILLIHGGLIVMMLGELVTGLFAVEGNMIIEKARTSNFLIHPHHSELAVIFRGDPKEDHVVVIPSAMLQKGGLIVNDVLPFDVRVEKYMVNSGLLNQPPEGEKNLANAGQGLNEVAVEKPEVSGTSEDQKYDYPSAYVTFLEKGSDKLLGTYLVSAYYTGEMNERGYQGVDVAGKSYDVGLRFKRTYKPYTLHLLDFEHKVYQGTKTPKDFRSKVRLTDPEEQVDRNVEIYMNSPLRYRGETFYQSSFLPGDTGTILQVVRNPGWLMPYFSCAIVTLGMMVHFGIHLLGFLRRRA
jgi:hypothetical protein